MKSRSRIKQNCAVVLIMLLVMMLFTSWPVYANADSLTESGQSTDVPIQLTTQGASFSATVPTVLPYCAYTDGTVMTAGCLKLINRSLGQIEVKKMVVELPEDWVYSKTGASEHGNAVRLIIQGKDVPGNGNADLEKFEAIDGGAALPVSVNACCDGESIEDGEIEQAKITIILGWNRSEKQ